MTTYQARLEALKEHKSLPIIKPKWWDTQTLEKSNARIWQLRRMVKQYVEGTMEKTVYQASGSTSGRKHVYTVKDGSLWLFKDNPSVKVHYEVARCVNGSFIGNSSSAFQTRYKGRKIWMNSAQQLTIQRIIAEIMPVVPFRMFEENNLDLNAFEIVEQGPEEFHHLRNRLGSNEPEMAHFTGAMVFRIADRYYLFDLDRNDLKMKTRNPFLTLLARPAVSIKDAYDSLKPDEVWHAERFLKRECPRQGEWFFIPVKGKFTRSKWKGEYTNSILYTPGRRHHTAEFVCEEKYVMGKVVHGGHEHPPLILDGWHKPVPNTSVESFTISGGID